MPPHSDSSAGPTQAHVLVIDEGTTGVRAALVSATGEIAASEYREITQHHPGAGQVEHDPEEIWSKTKDLCQRVVALGERMSISITAVAITNQRATCVLWDRRTGEPVCNAIVWQDNRTAALIDDLRDEHKEEVYRHTGAMVSTSYSSLKLAWLFETEPGLRQRAERGELAFGTVDSWLVWKLTNGASHYTSASNASSTGAYDLYSGEWFAKWLSSIGVPTRIFPEVLGESCVYGTVDESIVGSDVPIVGVVADQQSSLLGHGITRAGVAKCTHGTGTFINVLIGSDLTVPANGVSTRIAWRSGGHDVYALEGYTAVTGAALQWLRDGLGLIGDYSELETLVGSVIDNGGVYFVPALTGLSAPYWEGHVRGMITGLSTATTKAHILRATLEGIVYSTTDVLSAMTDDGNFNIERILVDGGLASSDFMLQHQADILNLPVHRPRDHSWTTCRGAALMAFSNPIVGTKRSASWPVGEVERVFSPTMCSERRDAEYANWRTALDSARRQAPQST